VSSDWDADNARHQNGRGVVSLCTTIAITIHTLLKHASLQHVCMCGGVASSSALGQVTLLLCSLHPTHIWQVLLAHTCESCHAMCCVAAASAVLVWRQLMRFSTAVQCVVGQEHIGAHCSRSRAVNEVGDLRQCNSLEQTRQPVLVRVGRCACVLGL
jgi:hypothetical protein